MWFFVDGLASDIFLNRSINLIQALRGVVVLIDCRLLRKFELTLLTLTAFTASKRGCPLPWFLTVVLWLRYIFLLIDIVFGACSLLLSLTKLLTKLRSSIYGLNELNRIDQILSACYPWVNCADVIVDLNVECWFWNLNTALAVWYVAQLWSSQVESVALRRSDTRWCSCLFLFNDRATELWLLLLILSLFRMRTLCFNQSLFLCIAVKCQNVIEYLV